MIRVPKSVDKGSLPYQALKRATWNRHTALGSHMSYHDLESSPNGSIGAEEGARLAALAPLVKDGEVVKDAAAAPVSRAAYWIFLAQGVGMLFPWNAFITATGARGRRTKACAAIERGHRSPYLGARLHIQSNRVPLRGMKHPLEMPGLFRGP